MKYSHVLSTVALTLLAGCGSMNYQIPAGSPSASLTLRNAVGQGEVGMTTHQNIDCRDAGKYVPGSTLKPGTEASVAIEAGRPFTFAVQSLRPVKGGNANVVVPGLIALNVCHVAGTFTPESGRQYVAVFTDEGNVCRVVVREADSMKSANTYVEKKWFPRTMNEGWRCSAE